MPKRDKLFADMAREDAVAVLLVAQVGGMPGEIQLIVQTAAYDAAQGGLRPLNNYIIRVLGVLEQRIHDLGMTADTVAIHDDHPLLYQHNAPPVALFFRGKPADVHELIVDISQAHASTFGPWRAFPLYLNVEQPLVTLLTSGGGLLGQMPQPLADRLVKVLEKHALEYKALSDTATPDIHDNVMLKGQKAKALQVGDSFFIANAFSIEELGKV